MGARRCRVVWSEGARRELDEAVAYVSEDSIDRAVRVLDEILESAASLATLSERGHIVRERGDTDIRELLVGSYRLLYHVTESEVEILGLLHQRRDFEGWRGVSS